MKRTLTAALGILAVGWLTASAADAKENWEKSCQKCHGADGKGQTVMGKKLKIKDYTDAKVQDEMKDAEMTKLIKEGKKEGDKQLMKGYADDLKDQEIKDLVAFIRKFKK
jgi:cytochrome c553